MNKNDLEAKLAELMAKLDESNSLLLESERLRKESDFKHKKELERKDAQINNANQYVQIIEKNYENKLKEKDKHIERITSIYEARLTAKELELEQEKTLTYKLNKSLNDLLAKKTAQREKLHIAQRKPFVKKTEQKATPVINETEEIKKETRKSGRPKGSTNFSDLDFDKFVSNTIYEDPEYLECDLCNGSLHLVGEKNRYEARVIPARIEFIKIIKRIYKCPKCNKDNNKLYYPLSTSAFPKSILTPSLAAYIAYCKFELGIPYNHLEKHLTNELKIPISKQLLASWMVMLSNVLEKIFERMRSDLKDNTIGVIHADETTLVVSKKPDESKNRKTSYVYVYTTSYYDKQIQIYSFHEARSIDRTAKWLSEYKGYVVCDDYSGYTKLAKDNPNIKLQRCWAHARRRLVEIVKILSSEGKNRSIAASVLELIDQLFHLEAGYKRDGLIPSAILDRRKQEHPQILEEIRKKVFETFPAPNSALESALNYIKKIWNELTTYLECGYLEISNNIAERAVKPFVINRKIFMTSGSYAGAEITTKIFSIIRTALINNLNIQEYLIYAIENIDKKNIEELLPYYENLPKELVNK